MNLEGEGEILLSFGGNIPIRGVQGGGGGGQSGSTVTLQKWLLLVCSMYIGLFNNFFLVLGILLLFFLCYPPVYLGS